KCQIPAGGVPGFSYRCCQRRCCAATCPVIRYVAIPPERTQHTMRTSDAGRADPVDHEALRQAVGAFAAEPCQKRALEVLRLCMYGELLLDITGSDGSFPAPGPAYQSLVQPAHGVLELARKQGAAWLYIDPAGPTCALSAADIEFALRNPHNEALKKALAQYGAGTVDRKAVLQFLRREGPLILAADESQPGGARVRTLTHDGRINLPAFTSAAEAVAYTSADATFAVTTLKALTMISQHGYAGIVVNPGGPFIAFSTAELFDQATPGEHRRSAPPPGRNHRCT